MTITTARWTLSDYHQMIEADILTGRSVELLNGEIIEMSPEGPEHAQLSTDAADYLRSVLRQHALIRDAKPITLSSSGSEPEPDIAVVQPLRDLYRTRHPYPENIFWLIEYANTSLEKDLDQKRSAYASANIPEYWVVNLKQRELVVLRNPAGGGYQVEETLSDGIIYPLAFPKVAIAVKQLL
ncbi:MAG: Uma2 family endonuclease [Elainellaceae cyanobacterium]